jgi:hypothetical protein
MSLDGLRAWIGVVERKLTMRTRVFLVLVAIAIGGAGAGIYLAIDAQNSSVSEADLQALQERVETQSGATGGTELSTLEAQINALQEEVAQLRSGQQGSENGGGTGTDGGSSAGTGGASAAPEKEQLKKSLEQTQEDTNK